MATDDYNTSGNGDTEHFFGIPLSTFRSHDHYAYASQDGSLPDGLDSTEISRFMYELEISAIAILFFRTTIYSRSLNEPRVLRWSFAILLAFLAYSAKSYELISTVELFSYAVPFALYSDFVLVPSRSSSSSAQSKNENARRKKDDDYKGEILDFDRTRYRLLFFSDAITVTNSKIVRLVSIAIGALISFLVCHYTASGDVFHWLSIVTPRPVMEGLSWLFPIKEVSEAYDVLDHFIIEPGILRQQCARLLFITYHIQYAMGFLGIGFLTAEQHRRNELIRMDIPTEKSRETDQVKNGQKESIDSSESNDGNPSNDTNANLDAKMQRARRFQNSAIPFIFGVAVPYMIQIIAYGNMNAFAYTCFNDDLHRSLRIYDLFSHENHLVAMTTNSPKAPSAYASYVSTVVSTVYDLLNRKAFSLPKIVLLPTVLARQPMLTVQIFPVIFFTDWLKGKAVSYMTSRIETLQRESQELEAIRSKVESFDIKNAELLQRSGIGATKFTQRRWEELTVQIQMKAVTRSLVARTKGFFAWLHRNFVFSVLVDCALAHLLAVEKIVSAEIFVFSRSIEDTVDTLLMRSRSEAELARMMTQIDNLRELSEVWEKSKSRNLLHCNIDPKVPEYSNATVVFRNLHYSRGTASVRIDHLELSAGVWALTGGNGSGKSTLFRLIMSCNTNDRAIDLDSSIMLSTPSDPLKEVDDVKREIECEAADEGTENSECDTPPIRDLAEVANLELHPRLSITMPSSHVAEISQNFYWPLYTRPIDWIYQEHISQTVTPEELEKRVRRVAEELFSLEFSQKIVGEHPDNTTAAPTESVIDGIRRDLLEVKEDWFSDLSGGQKSKVELVRKVFLLDECPHVLLIDETMAPLDPTSKSLVMNKIRQFCAKSVVLVIYHTDVGQEKNDSNEGAIECVPSSNFFTGNIHVEDHMVKPRSVCEMI